MKRMNDRVENIKLKVTKKLDSMLEFDLGNNNIEEEKGLNRDQLQKDLEGLLKETIDYNDYNYSFEVKCFSNAFEKILKKKSESNDENMTIKQKNSFIIKNKKYNYNSKNKLSLVENENKCKLSCKNYSNDVKTENVLSKSHKIFVCSKNPNQEKCKQVIQNKGGGSSVANTMGYKLCTGKYVKGCKSPRIKELQNCLGTAYTGKNDIYFGDLTQAALKANGYENGVTDADIDKICNKEIDSPVVDSDSLNVQ